MTGRQNDRSEQNRNIPYSRTRGHSFKLYKRIARTGLTYLLT